MFMVEVAYEIQRYDDCLKYLTPLMKNSSDVDIKKMKIWSNCWKQIINKKRSAWVMILTPKTNSDIKNVEVSVLNEYKLIISSDIICACNTVIQFINDYLMDAVSNVDHKILAYQICGDNHRYKAEVSDGKIKYDNYQDALNEYKSGWQLCLQKNVSSYVILYLAVKYAICLKCVYGSDRAIFLIEEALNMANQRCDRKSSHVHTIIERVIKYKQTLTGKAKTQIVNSQ